MCCAGLCLVAKSCPTLCDPMNYRLQVALSLRNLQVRMLERVAMLSSRGLSQPRDQTQVSHIADRFISG